MTVTTASEAANATTNATPLTSTTVSAEETRKMKAQLGTGLPTPHQRTKEKFFVNLQSTTVVITDKDVEMLDTVYIKNCQDTVVELRTTCTKVFVEGCRGLTFHLEDRVLTSTVEVWKCEETTLKVNTKVQTLQLDMSKQTSIHYGTTDHFNRLVWSSSEDVHLSFADAEEHRLSTGSSQQAAANAKINPETDQFIVRLVPNKVTGKVQLLNELVVRLDNGFPTTEREARQFEERQEANLQKLARDILGQDIVLGKKKQTGPKVKPNDPCTCGSSKKFKKCCGSNVN